ncbi:hypothetical protein ACWC9T_41095 [Kitasatospora sp. NPDC001159]
MVGEDPYAIWPYHLHGAIRTALRTDDTTTADRWTPADWHQAAERALAALGGQWRTHSPATGRAWLVACLRQGLRLARDHRLDDLAWLTDAAFAYIDDSVWEPIAPPAPAPGDRPAADTPADALAELLTAISRRQHEHRDRTARRLTAVLDGGLLTDELTELALYYRAKADKDLGRTAASLDGMRHVAAAGGRLAPQAQRGIANLARIAGDFPAAMAAASTLTWKSRRHRVRGDSSGPRATSPPPPRPCGTAGPRPSSTTRPASGPSPRPAWPWSPPSPTRPGPTRRSTSPANTWNRSTSAPPACTSRSPAWSETPAPPTVTSPAAPPSCTPRSTSPACPGSSRCWRPPSPSTTPSWTPRTT